MIFDGHDIKAQRPLGNAPGGQKALGGANHMLLLGPGDALFGGALLPAAQRARADSTNTSVSPSYPIRSISPFTPAG